MNTIRYMFRQPAGRRLRRVAAVLLALALTTAVVLAAGPPTGTFVGIDAARGQFVRFTRPDGRVISDWSGVLRLQLDKNTPGDKLGPLVNVFCIQLFVLVRANDIYVANGPVTALPGGCHIRYLLSRYPGSTVATTAEGAARQLAIWHFSDNLDLNTVQDAAIKARAIALANEATQAVATNGCPVTNPGLTSLTLDPPNTTVPQGQAVLYTVRVDPTSAATTVDIAVDGTAQLSNGLQQATYPLNQGVATFTVTNLGVGLANVTATLPYLMDAGTVFDPRGARATQRLVLADGLQLSATAQVQTTWQQATPTATPTAIVSTATPTPVGATATPTPFGGGGTATPTPVGGGGTATPTPVGGGGTPTSTPAGGGGTATATPAGGGGGTATPTPTGGGTPTQPASTTTPTPGGGPDLTPTATPAGGGGGGATATPSGGGGEATPTPSEGGQATPTSPAPEATPGGPGGGTPTGPAGGVPVPLSDGSGNPAGIVPRSLPNTGGQVTSPIEWLIVALLGLILAGAVLRRSARR